MAWFDFTRPGRRDSTTTRSAMLTASPMSCVTRIAVLSSRRQRALAATALADDSHELAGGDRERNVLERLGLAFKAEIAQADAEQLDLGPTGADGCRCRHGSLRLVGEFGEHERFELHALGVLEHVTLHQDVLKLLHRLRLDLRRALPDVELAIALSRSD